MSDRDRIVEGVISRKTEKQLSGVNYIEEIPVEARVLLYWDIADRLMKGEPVDEQQIRLLAYGMSSDEEAEDKGAPDYIEIDSALRDAEFFNPNLAEARESLNQQMGEMQTLGQAFAADRALGIATELVAAGGIARGTNAVRLGIGQAFPRLARVPFLGRIFRSSANAHLPLQTRVMGSLKKLGLLGGIGTGGFLLGNAFGFGQAKDQFTPVLEQQSEGLEKADRVITNLIQSQTPEEADTFVQNQLRAAQLFFGQFADEPDASDLSFFQWLQDPISPTLGAIGRSVFPHTQNVIVIDPQTGQQVVVETENPEPLPGGQTPDYAPEFLELLSGLGVDPSTLSGGGLGLDLPGVASIFGRGAGDLNIAGVNPNFLGSVQVPWQNFPFGLTIQGGALREPFNLPPALALETGLLPEDDQISAETGLIPPIPAGAAINPRAFTVYQGRTLLEIAGEAAVRYQVPFNLLYGIINRESGWAIDPGAGDNGTSFGLAQIHLPAHPHITAAQALDPVFALNWAAQNLYNNYIGTGGNWEAAVISHRGGIKQGRHYAEFGTFFSERDKLYLEGVLEVAAASGLGGINTLGALFDIGLTEVATPEPEPPPFIAPDEATLKEFIRTVFPDIIGFEPDEAAFAKGVENLMGSYRAAYDKALERFQATEGKEFPSDVGIDPGARYLDALRGTGAAQFREDVTQTDSVFDWFAQMASILNSGV